MSSDPSSPGFIDTNARLLASVIPPPPPSLWARFLRFATTRSSGDLRSVARWSRSWEGRACFVAALAGSALTLGIHGSESSSAADAGPAPMQRDERPAALATATSVRSKPLALTPAATRAAAAARTSESAAAVDVGTDEAKAASDGADDPARAAPLADASEPIEAARPVRRQAASAKSRVKKKKFAKKSRKSKRQSVARASARKKRTKSPRQATAAGPLAAWLATQRSKEPSSAKRR